METRYCQIVGPSKLSYFSAHWWHSSQQSQMEGQMDRDTVCQFILAGMGQSRATALYACVPMNRMKQTEWNKAPVCRVTHTL